MTDDIATMDATTIARKVADKELSPVEVVDSAITRADALDETLHAFNVPTPELARDSARALADRIAAGEQVGPLAGVPVAVKDLVAQKDVLFTSGTEAYKDFVAEEDDVSVERMRAADAIFLGKTNVSELGYSGASHNPLFETTRNPWNIERNPGASSAGSAVAAATNTTPLAIGSDGGGSIRIPASFCGVYGMKASMGRVPIYPAHRDERYPGLSGWESIEHVGPITRTVQDAALMLSVIASGPDDRDRHSLPGPEFDWLECLTGDVRGLRVAYSADWGYAAVDPQVREIVGRAVKVFEDLGCEIDEADPGWDDPYDAFWATVAMDTDLRGMREIVAEHGDNMSAHLVDFLLRDWTAEDFTDAAMTRKAVYNKMWRFMRRYDLVLTPTLAVPPFALDIQGPEKIDGRIGAPFRWLAFTFPINLTGQPAATVPAGWTDDGLPIGLQIIGRHLDDPLVLRASAAYEDAAPWKDQWPPIVANVPPPAR